MIKGKCWSVISGIGAGSMISLNLGGKVERARPLSNDLLTKDEREFVGEWGIFTAGSFWVIVVDGWGYVDASCSALTISEKTRIIIGESVESANRNSFTGVLSMKFTSGIYVTIYPAGPEDDSYCVFHGLDKWDGVSSINSAEDE